MGWFKRKKGSNEAPVATERASWRLQTLYLAKEAASVKGVYLAGAELVTEARIFEAYLTEEQNNG